MKPACKSDDAIDHPPESRPLLPVRGDGSTGSGGPTAAGDLPLAKRRITRMHAPAASPSPRVSAAVTSPQSWRASSAVATSSPTPERV